MGWEAKSSGIDCSRKFKLTILYCYLVDKRAALDSDNPQLPYEKCKMLTSPLQVLSKMLYPRVYTLQDTLSLKNIKFQAKKFGTASITLLDNGRRLFMLVGEDTPQNILQKLVGYSNS